MLTARQFRMWPTKMMTDFRMRSNISLHAGNMLTSIGKTLLKPARRHRVLLQISRHGIDFNAHCPWKKERTHPAMRPIGLRPAPSVSPPAFVALASGFEHAQDLWRCV